VKVQWELVIGGVAWFIFSAIDDTPTPLTDKEFVMWLGCLMIALGLFWRNR